MYAGEDAVLPYTHLPHSFLNLETESGRATAIAIIETSPYERLLLAYMLRSAR